MKAIETLAPLERAIALMRDMVKIMDRLADKVNDLEARVKELESK